MIAQHRVVTVQRGHDEAGRDTYAARCENCGAITFGGFPTRTAAREALAEHEEAPTAAATADEGEDQEPNLHEGEPITTMIAETEEDREARYVAEHPEISATVPSWVDELEVDLRTPDIVAFTGRRMVGSVEIVASGDRTPESVALVPEKAFSLWFPSLEHDEDTGRALAAYARRIAVDLITAAALLDEEAAS